MFKFKSIGFFASRAVSNNCALRVYFLLSLMLVSVGGFRMAYYSLPMWQGDYEYAGSKIGYFSAGHYDEKDMLPEMRESAWDKTASALVHAAWASGDFMVGSRAQALFNSGCQHYDANDYQGAQSRFERAYTELCDKQGRVSSSNRKQASLLQTMIGNCWDNAGKKENAGPYYEQALALNPNNLLATWLLERLQDSNGGAAKNTEKNDKDNPDTKPSAPRKRI